MPSEDALRWNARYEQEEHNGWKSEPRDWLISHLDDLPSSGLALDVAMGLGENARVLLERGWHVVGVDISSRAVVAAKRKLPRLQAVVADLTELRFPSATFDLILNFYYLDRDLLRDYARILKPGGRLLVESLMQGMQQVKPQIQARFLLEPGELERLYADWEILDRREGWFNSANGHSKAISAILARKP
jgi:SAM-dependent methyltransferase